MLTPPYPELDDLLLMMGQAGRHLAEIETSERAAGNISIRKTFDIKQNIF